MYKMNSNMKVNNESQFQVTIGKLLETAADKNALITDTLNVSICKIAKVHPNQILNSCCHFCKMKKDSSEHIARVLLIMETITCDNLMQLDGDTILETIEFILEIMIREVGHAPNIQNPACGILVALGRKHYVQVMEALLNKLQVGVIPHFMIPHTLGTLASANAFGVVPYLKNILNILLPLLPGIKTASLKHSFSYAIGSFCDALLEYTMNVEQAPDPTIAISNFHHEMGIAYDVFYLNWLHSREVKVTECVLNALSSMYAILNAEKITQQTSKIIPTLLNTYKKQTELYYVTKCLCSVIQISARVNGTLLEPLLTPILQALIDLIAISPDYAQPDLLRCHSESLRCYECLAKHFTDNTIDHLLMQLKNNNDKERIRALLILTHLTNSAESAIQSRSQDILKFINEMLTENNIRVKKVLLKTIVAFSYKGILFNTESNSSGPEKYMEFILKLCCKQTLSKNSDVDGQELWDIQKSADNTLYMLSTSIPELENILWDLLLRCFLDPMYDEACVVILRCLTHLAVRKANPECGKGAFIRCFALLAQPLPSFRGTFVINFLKNIRLCSNEAYKSVWDTKVPQLLKYLEQNYETFHLNEWHDLLFDLFTLILESIQDPKFNEVLVQEIKNQLPLYNNRFMCGTEEFLIKQIEKCILLKYLAFTACYLNDKQLVLQTLDIILESIKLNDMTELEACAEAIGTCSRNQLQIVLDKLGQIRKDVLLKKTRKFFQFNFMKDQKNDLEVERVRFVIISSYAEVCNKAPTEKLLQTIQSTILDFIMDELNNCKDFIIRKACLRAIASIADAMHPNRNILHIHMQERNKVMQLVASQMQLHSGSEYIELFPNILPVLTLLSKLPLILESNERIQLLKLCFDNVYNASAIYCKITQQNAEPYYGESKLVQYIVNSFIKLNQLVQELLMQSLSPATLDEIVTLLEPWLNKKKAEQKLPAVETLRIILQTYLDHMKFAYDTPSSFGQTGFLLARIIPRCTDPNRKIRKISIDCVYLVLCIASRYEGHMRDHDKILSNSLQSIQQQIETEEPKLLYNLTTDLAHVISINMPQFQLLHFVDALLDGLLDCESSSSGGSGIVLNIVLKNKGSELQTHVNRVIEKLLKQLWLIKCVKTKSAALRSVLSIASHHLRTTVLIILSQPLPYEQYICECWHILSTDSSLIVDILEQLKKVIKQTPLYEEQAGDMRIATLQPLQAISSMDELFRNTQIKEICQQQFPEMFSILLIVLASYIGTSPPVIQKQANEKEHKYSFVMNREAYKMHPAKIAMNTFKQYLLCCGYVNMASNLLTCTHLDAGNNLVSFQNMVAVLVKDVFNDVSQSVSWIVSCLGPYIRAELEPQRIAVVAFLANLLNQKINDQTVLTENLLEMLLDMQNDSSVTVRKLALEGLGFGAENLNNELVIRHCNPILSALMQGLDYRNLINESSVVLEAMLSFSKLLHAVEGQRLSSCQVTAAVRIKPLLSQEDATLREASIRLFGNLSSSLSPDSNTEAFKEQVQGNIITLLLHLCDINILVIKSCKFTLRKVAPFLESPKVNSMIQEHLIDEANLHYLDFITDLIKLMAEELQDLLPLLIMTSLSYLKSPWVEIRGNAALMAGVLYSQLNCDNKPRVSLDTICDRLVRLLSDEEVEVQAKAVQATAYLFLDH